MNNRINIIIIERVNRIYPLCRSGDSEVNICHYNKNFPHEIEELVEEHNSFECFLFTYIAFLIQCNSHKTVGM